MSVPPIILPAGQVSIYGLGEYLSPSGQLIISGDDWKFGYVNSTYAGGAVFVYDGDAVMFREKDVLYRVQFLDYPYTIIPAKLVTRQDPPV